MAGIRCTRQAHSNVNRTRRLALFSCAALMGMALAGCGSDGFKPMYGSLGSNGASTEQKLAQVDMTTIPGRVGQQVRNEFIFQSTGGGARLEPVYQLQVVLHESLTSSLVQVTGDARAQTYQLQANFRLVRVADKSVVMEGASHARAGFERFNSIFSNVRARQDAEDRAAKVIGEDLRSRIAAFLSTTA